MENKPSYYAIIPANVRYDKDLAPNAKLLYGEITALTSAEGYCWASNAYFADLYDVTKRSIQLWLSQLETKGFIRISLDSKESKNSTRKIYINFIGEENYTPPRKKVHGGDEENFAPTHEKNFTHNNTSINTTNNNTTNKKTNKKKISSADLEKEFEQLWKIYPRKIGKEVAKKSFIKARKDKKIPYETIENGLYRYINYLETQGTEEQYIMHGSTWMNQAKWEDEYICVATKKKPKNATEYLKAKYGGDNYESRGNRKIIDDYSKVIPEFF